MWAAAIATLAVAPDSAHAARTACGYPPSASAPCDDQCFVFDPATDQCVDSCGHACKTDGDCGLWPASPCSMCVGGHCSGDAQFGNCTQLNPRAPGGKQAPVLPAAWNASFVMTNYTHFGGSVPAVSHGFTWYDASVGGLRQDFEAPCPFVELQAPLRNNGSCSVLFYKGYNYYVYGHAGSAGASVVGGTTSSPEADGQSARDAGSQPPTCCKYHFPGWQPDSYRVGNASWGGREQVGGVAADHWRFSYTCPWLGPAHGAYQQERLPAYTVQRDIWTRADSNTPVRMNETLTSGYSDFADVQVGPQNTQLVFASFLDSLKCLEKGTDPHFLRVCNNYNARGRLVDLGFA